MNVLSCVSALRDREVDAVIHAAVLGDRSEHRLVVRSGVDREETVGTSSEALGDISSNDTIAIRGSVDTLEERERGGVGGLSLIERGESLNDDVSVTKDDVGVVELSWSGVVVELGVREEAELYSEVASVGRTTPRYHAVTYCHVLNLHLDGEGLIRLESAEVLGENELAAGEVRLWNDTAHRDDVARAGTDLLAVGQGNVLGQAKVDEVVLGGQGRNLTRNRDLLSVEGKAGLDDTGIEGQRFLRIFGSSRRSSGIRGSSLYGAISTTDMIHGYKIRHSLWHPQCR